MNNKDQTPTINQDQTPMNEQSPDQDQKQDQTPMKNRLINTLFATQASWGSLALRLPIGIIFMAHGSQKLFGWFGGYGLQGTGQFMESLGLTPGVTMALLSGGTEFFGGLALIIGLLTRPAAAGLAFTMVMAIMTAHIGNGLFMSNNGYEFALALLAATAALFFNGAGRLSLDAAIAQSVKGSRS